MHLHQKYNTAAFTMAKTAAKIHPQSNYILREAESQSQKLGIHSEAFYTSHHTMVPYIFVDIDTKRAVLITVWFSTLYYLDDFLADNQNSSTPLLDFNRLFAVWMGEDNDWSDLSEEQGPLFDAVAYCSKQFRAHAPTAYFERYTEYLRQHMLRRQTMSTVSSAAAYIESRVALGEIHPAIGMIEYANDSYLENALFVKYPALAQAVRYCTLVGVLSNDLISYHKDIKSQQNLLNVYLSSYAVKNLEEAIQEGISDVNECYTAFLAHRNQVLEEVEDLADSEKTVITSFLAGLAQLTSASYHWQTSTNRYRSPDNIFENLKCPIEEMMLIAI